MTMKMAPVTKSGCAVDVGNTVSSAVAGAAVGDDRAVAEDATGRDGDGDAEAMANSVVAPGSVTSTSAMRSPVRFRGVTAGKAATDPLACTGSERIQSRRGRRRSS